MNTIARSLWLEWEQARPLIAVAVVGTGCPSLTAYAASRPREDLLDLARRLAIVGVHSGHLQLRLWEEAAEAGDLARCARDLLVRALSAKLRAWAESGGSRTRHLEDAFYHWRDQLPQNYRHVEDQVRSAVLAVEPPTDWCPENPDDPILVSLFKQHWPAEPTSRRYRMQGDCAARLTIEAEREHAEGALLRGAVSRVPRTHEPTPPNRQAHAEGEREPCAQQSHATVDAPR